MEDIQVQNYISIQSISDSLGRNDPKGNMVADVRRNFPQICSKRRVNHRGPAVWCIPISEKEDVLRRMGFTGEEVIEPQPKKRISYAHVCADDLSNAGWITICPDDAGTPDVIAFKKRSDGGFDVCFREAKGPKDTISKEQYEFVRRMTELGFDAGFSWF